MLFAAVCRMLGLLILIIPQSGRYLHALVALLWQPGTNRAAIVVNSPAPNSILRFLKLLQNNDQ